MRDQSSMISIRALGKMTESLSSMTLYHFAHEWAVRAGRYPDETLWEWEKTEVAKLSKRVRESKSAERIVGAPP